MTARSMRFFEFPDVARPFVAEELAHRLRGEIRGIFFEFRCVFLQENTWPAGGCLLCAPAEEGG